MHNLFHTSVPPFQYQTEVSKRVARSLLDGQGPTPHAVLTMDAGANLHVFVPREEQESWETFVRKTFPEIPFIVDVQGLGANYVSEHFRF